MLREYTIEISKYGWRVLLLILKKKNFQFENIPQLWDQFNTSEILDLIYFFYRYSLIFSIIIIYNQTRPPIIEIWLLFSMPIKKSSIPNKSPYHLKITELLLLYKSIVFHQFIREIAYSHLIQASRCTTYIVFK